MSQELRKKAVEMLLNGATLVAEPCPYCKGVRVMKNGNAMCISCGKEPGKKLEAEQKKSQPAQKPNQVLESLNKKLEQLGKELEAEKDHQKQQQILQSINSLVETIQKLQK
jgi:UPF0148 protein